MDKCEEAIDSFSSRYQGMNTTVALFCVCVRLGFCVVHVCVRAWSCLCAFVFARVCVRACSCASMFVFVHVCVCVRLPFTSF